ncbi:unnamed protein product [Protopolystoma xenopodis]|uniref:Uncharacterized protein n=1 Tax=Protopolystoma xenopodis TaxID=117903 RepID=A0A3S4ZYN9_9PLAT|nr:unnamed protein product [Protopolystoma xenopodis]
MRFNQFISSLKHLSRFTSKKPPSCGSVKNKPVSCINSNSLVVVAPS